MRRRHEDSADTLRFAYIVEREVAKADLPARGMLVLLFLGQQPDGQASFPEVRDGCAFEASQTTYVCDILIGRGLIVRVTPPEDHRKSVLRLTARGRSVLGQIEKKIKRHAF